MRLKQVLLGLGLLLIVGFAVTVGHWSTVVHYEDLLKSERQRVNRIEADYEQMVNENKADHAGKIRWLQNRQYNELERVRSDGEMEQRRRYREALYVSCMVAFARPDRSGYIPPYQTGVMQCNAWAAAIWQANPFEKEPPPGIDHKFIKGESKHLRTS